MGLEGGDTVEADGLWQVFDVTEVVEGAVRIDAVDADGSASPAPSHLECSALPVLKKAEAVSALEDDG
ncbi:MAG TPA: hypothetical protein VHT28_18950 [Silvibacterium sp.]|nr:hypothetical protein [Silvibacterium sp.]